MAKPAVPSSHEKYLVKPTQRFAEKMRLLEVNPERFHPLPPICGPKVGTIVLTPKARIDPHIGELKPYVGTVRAKSLDHLKEWVGVPNRALEKKRECRCAALREVRIHHLPAEEDFDFDRLEPERRQAVRDTAHNLLYGYADAELVARPPYRGVVRFMLDRARRIPVFQAKDLIVCPDETVEFNGFATLVFNNVVVYGNGRIRFHGNVKLHANQVRHV